MFLDCGKHAASADLNCVQLPTKVSRTTGIAPMTISNSVYVIDLGLSQMDFNEVVSLMAHLWEMANCKPRTLLYTLKQDPTA